MISVGAAVIPICNLDRRLPRGRRMVVRLHIHIHLRTAVVNKGFVGDTVVQPGSEAAAGMVRAVPFNLGQTHRRSVSCISGHHYYNQHTYSQPAPLRNLQPIFHHPSQPPEMLFSRRLS
ncbi:hypothetical protein D3C81_1983950 [compost metagenome]